MMSSVTGNKPPTPPKRPEPSPAVDNGNRPGIVSVVDLKLIRGDQVSTTYRQKASNNETDLPFNVMYSQDAHLEWIYVNVANFISYSTPHEQTALFLMFFVFFLVYVTEDQIIGLELTPLKIRLF